MWLQCEDINVVNKMAHSDAKKMVVKYNQSHNLFYFHKNKMQIIHEYISIHLHAIICK